MYPHKNESNCELTLFNEYFDLVACLTAPSQSNSGFSVFFNSFQSSPTADSVEDDKIGNLYGEQRTTVTTSKVYFKEFTCFRKNSTQDKRGFHNTRLYLKKKNAFIIMSSGSVSVIN